MLLSRSTVLVAASRPLAFSLLRLPTAVRQLADVRVQLAGGALALALLAFIGIVRAPVFVDEADNILTACMATRGAIPYRDVFSHHFPAPYYALAAFGERAACSVLAGRVLGVVLLTVSAGLFAWAARSTLAPLAVLVMALAAPLYYLQLYLAETFICVGLVLSLALLTERGRQLRGPAGVGLRIAALLVLSSSSPLGLMMAVLLTPLIVLGAGRRSTGHRRVWGRAARVAAGTRDSRYAAGVRGSGHRLQHPVLRAVPASPVDGPVRGTLGHAQLCAPPVQFRDGLADRRGRESVNCHLWGAVRAAATRAARRAAGGTAAGAMVPTGRAADAAAGRLAGWLPPLAVRGGGDIRVCALDRAGYAVAARDHRTWGGDAAGCRAGLLLRTAR